MPWHPTDPDFTEEFAMQQFKKGLLYNEADRSWYTGAVREDMVQDYYKKSYKVVDTYLADDGGPAGYIKAYCDTLNQALIFTEMCGGSSIEYPLGKTSQDKPWLVHYENHIFWANGDKSRGITDGISTMPEYVEDEKTGIKVKMSQYGKYQSPPYER